MHKLILPLSVDVSTKKKDKKFILNLNNYRNTHYFTLNKAKIVFKEVMEDQIKLLPALDRVRIHYWLYPGSKREMDVSNVCSVQDKFLCDAIVEHNKMVDDNYKFLPGVAFDFGEVDPNNPRVEAHITPLTN